MNDAEGSPKVDMGNKSAEVPTVGQLEWYLAELVVEITVASNPDRVVHVLLVLVEAADAESAYQASVTLGQAHTDEYLNPKGECVKRRFAGLRNLSYIDDELTHGTEVAYEESILSSATNSLLPVKGKADLGVFDRKRHSVSKKPDYRYAEIESEARALMTTKDVPDSTL